MPGEISRAEQLARIVRVDHAGEFGAQKIYAGQLAVLGDTDSGPIIRHMAEQEDAHLEAFEKELVERRVRPSALMPFWSAAGYALGVGTALLGPRAAMACTVAVEEAIVEHYEEQATQLEGDADNADLKAKIEQFCAEEAEHRDIGLEHEAEKTPGYRLIHGAIRRGSKAAIWLATRV
ncbi:MAG: demethoxyubiquinone hydroxylase family protein [Pseudomonadota bacterium]